MLLLVAICRIVATCLLHISYVFLQRCCNLCRSGCWLVDSLPFESGTMRGSFGSDTHKENKGKVAVCCSCVMVCACILHMRSHAHICTFIWVLDNNHLNNDACACIRSENVGVNHMYVLGQNLGGTRIAVFQSLCL